VHLKVKESRIETTLACEASEETRINFARHFRVHQRNLGILSNSLDKVNDVYGVDSNEANEIGKQAFLQVSYLVLTVSRERHMPTFDLHFFLCRFVKIGGPPILPMPIDQIFFKPHCGQAYALLDRRKKVELFEWRV
jgi:hypothetical protein